MSSHELDKFFLWSGLLWLIMGTCFCFFFSDWVQFLLSESWMLGLWFLCMWGLFALVKTVASLMALVSCSVSALKPALIFQTFFWGIFKLLWLGIMGAVLWIERNYIPQSSLWIGLATFVFVPLLGGFLWSRQDLRRSEQHA